MRYQYKTKLGISRLESVKKTFYEHLGIRKLCI